MQSGNLTGEKILKGLHWGKIHISGPKYKYILGVDLLDLGQSQPHSEGSKQRDTEKNLKSSFKSFYF